MYSPGRHPFGSTSLLAPHVSGVPQVSVVLPVHNGMPYLEESVRSVLQQSFRDFELIIGDDGSTDGTTEVARALACEDGRIRLLRRERPSGLAGSANWVVSEARAPLIAVAHADDRSYCRRLERQVALLHADPGISLAGTLWDGIDEHGRLVRPGDYWRLLRRSRFAPFSHSSIMFRRRDFDRVGGYRSSANYWEDLDFYYRIAASGRIAVVPDVLCTVRHAEVSTRLRDGAVLVERAVDLMFRSAAEQAEGRSYDHLLADSVAAAKLHPMTFVSLGSTRLWCGSSPRVLGRMRTHARFRFDAASLHAVSWLLWASVSPRSLRAFLRTVIAVRNPFAKQLCRRRGHIEWVPSRGGARASSRASLPLGDLAGER